VAARKPDIPKKTADSRNGEEIPFEQALERLEEIVDSLESGEPPLEAALALFEEGVGLSRRCHERLARAERRLEILVEKAGGEAAVETLDEEEFLAGDGEKDAP
jgi:exodeoxyribonuclease VII small subunit